MGHFLFATLALFSQQGDAKALLEELYKRYGELQAFECTIIHQNSSGLYPGAYEQSLKWKAGKFELKVTKRSDFVPKKGGVGTTSPDFYCNGREVLYVRDGHIEAKASPTPDQNTMPGWEVSGGLLMSILQKTRNARWLLNPSEPYTLTYKILHSREWKGERIRPVEITASMKGDNETVVLTLFIAADELRLIGWEARVRSASEEIVSWMWYRDQKFNPPLPDELGTYKDG